MEISEQELRTLVRDAIARHGAESFVSAYSPATRSDPSHLLLPVAPGSDLGDGACVIEPTVRCNHCGYCQSLGH